MSALSVSVSQIPTHTGRSPETEAKDRSQAEGNTQGYSSSHNYQDGKNKNMLLFSARVLVSGCSYIWGSSTERPKVTTTYDSIQNIHKYDITLQGMTHFSMMTNLSCLYSPIFFRTIMEGLRRSCTSEMLHVICQMSYVSVSVSVHVCVHVCVCVLVCICVLICILYVDFISGVYQFSTSNSNDQGNRERVVFPTHKHSMGRIKW